MHYEADQIIFHIDVNSAFLSWSALKLLSEGFEQDIREIPAIVGGDQSSRHGIVVAKSIPAKRYGIKTADTVASAFRRCPDLFMTPPDHAYYKMQSQKLMNYLRSVCSEIEQASIDECYMAYGSIAHRFTSPEAAAVYIKDQVREQFGFTVNVGISDKKVLAKMASDFTKPDKVHTLYSHEIQSKMWPLPVGELYMCGKSAASRLQMLGIRTIGDLANSDQDMIRSQLKSHGLMLWQFAWGIDDRGVNPVRERAKGVGNSTTLSEDVSDRADACKVLRKLCQSVSDRLKKHGFLAGSVCVEIKYADFKSVSHQCPLLSETRELNLLYKESCRLFDELWDGSPIRLLGVRTTKLVDEDIPRQMNLFDYQIQKEKDEKSEKLEAALAQIRGRFGDASVRKLSDHLD